MSITIPFTPEVESKLRERAAAEGKDLASFVREAVEERLGVSTDARRDSDRWTGEFSAWMREVAARAHSYPPDSTVDDSRESIYEGRGE